LQQLEVGEFVSGHLRSLAIARDVLVRAIPVRAVRGLVVALLALAWTAAFAQGTGADPSMSFDHATTGFSLGSQHALARCESCHIQGVFRGTPRDCASCHRNASRPMATQFPVRHIPTTLPCDTCHRAAAWNVVIYRHQDVTKGTCLTCHNGTFAQGKPAGHVVTIASCDTCHNTLTWFGTNYNHAGVAAGTCATCHNGTKATGKPANHVATTASCDTCHTTLVWTPASFPHDATMAGRCSTCHNGTSATGKSRGHIPTNSQCDTCHTNFTAFRPAVMNHAGLAGQCSTCHSGAYVGQNAQAKSGAHLPTTQQCDVCHSSTTTWATATFDHAANGVVIGAHTCSTNCHIAGRQGLPKPTNHVPTTQACDVCHTNFTAFAPAAMNHDGTAGKCLTCHGVSTYAAMGAIGKPSRHVVTSAQCDVCHTVATWIPAHYAHDSLAPNRCSNCHNNVTATGKGATHIPDNRQCDSCHKNYTAFRPATMNHTGLAGQCSTCHSGAYVGENAQTKSAFHLVTTAQCDTCHKSTTTWATVTFNHAGTTPPTIIGGHTCANAGCHVSGGSGLPKPGTHIPTTAFCDTCHLNFTTFRQATMNHSGTAGQCSSCHNGAYVAVGSLGAQTKPATHVTTALQCDSCHSTSAWKPATYAHAPSAAGNCSSCHNGITATGKAAGHIPDARQCDTCHTSTTTFVVLTMNHTGLAGQCSTCHSGAYVSQNAQAKSASHVPTTQQCDSCHRSTTSWATVTFNHAGTTPPTTIGGHTCASAGCHVAGGRGLPKPTRHVPTTGACDNCHTNFVAFAPATMNHTGTNGQCSTCHNGAYTSVNALGKPSGHVTTTQSCDACHSTAAWTPAGFSHSGVAAGTCVNCHNGTTATGKISGHIPTTASCDQCHRTSAWMPLLTPYSHSGVTVGSCANCHMAGYANIDVKPANHIPTTFACDQCHRTTAWLPLKTPYGHTGVAPGTCSTCHVSTYANIVALPAIHIPTTPYGSNCDSCHKSYTSFANARIHRTVFTSITSFPATCLNCHFRGNPYGVKQPPNDTRHTRAPGNGSCDQSGCHRSVTGF
jgi:hypothetical protein